MFDDPSSRIPSGPAGETTDTPAVTPAATPAVERFRSCRWYRAAEDSQPECCSHRDVLPLAGATGFDPEAWCPDCTFYKVRRTPRKRTYDNDYRY
jgi:hypothetical protein